MKPLLSPAQLALVSSERGLNYVDVMLEFPKRLAKREWDALVRAVYSHQVTLSRRQRGVVIIGRCVLVEGQILYQTHTKGIKPPKEPWAKVVFVRRRMTYHVESLIRMLVERQLRFDSTQAMPSGIATLEEHKHELQAQFSQHRTFAVDRLGSKEDRADAETLRDTCGEIVALLHKTCPTPADMQQLAWSAFEAGKALARIEGRPTPLLLSKLSRAEKFSEPRPVSTEMLFQDALAYMKSHDGKPPTARQLLAFAGYKQVKVGQQMMVTFTGIEHENGITLDAFRKRLESLRLGNKRRRGRPRKGE